MKRIVKLIFIQLPFVPLVAAAATTQDLPGVDLDITKLFGILTGLACWMSRFILVFMTMAIIWYGFQFLISRGNPTAFASAKKSLWYGIIGVVIVLGAYTIISTVGNAVRGANGGVGPSYNNYLPLDCTNFSAVINP